MPSPSASVCAYKKLKGILHRKNAKCAHKSELSYPFLFYFMHKNGKALSEPGKILLIGYTYKVHRLGSS